jgi:hypothetical protein
LSINIFCFTQRRRVAERRTLRKNFAELLAAALALSLFSKMFNGDVKRLRDGNLN